MADGPGADDSATLLPDLLLGRYRVEGVLGEGGLGRVVRAYDTRLGRMVAIKTLKRSLAATDPGYYRTSEDRFAREAAAGARVGDHPNLVTVHDMATDAEGTEYLICQYVPGGTLADRIAQGPIPLAEALRLTADVARGLAAAHEAGIVHRDIKPANIFLAADGHAQVGDFGIAQMDHLSNRTHATMSHPGTPLYMSPEQAQTTGYVRPDTDQYSLGLVLFEMLTGKAYKRLRESQAEALLAKQPSDVAALVRRMAATRPDDRYETMDQIVTAIGDIEQGLSSAVVPASQREKPPAPATPERPHDTPRLPDITVPDPARRQATPSDPIPPEPTRPSPQVYIPTIPERTARHEPSRPVPSTSARLALPISSQQASRRHTRRAVLAGIGGVVLAAGGSAGAIALTHAQRNGPEATTAANKLSPVSIVPPALIGTPLAQRTNKITPDNAKDMTQIARWGKGVPYRVWWFPDGKQFAIASSLGFYFYNVQGSQETRFIDTNAWTGGAALSPDGSMFALPGNDAIQLLRVSDGAIARTIASETKSVERVAFSPDGKTLVGSFNEDLRLWGVRDGTALRTLSGHRGSVRDVAFSPDGTLLCSASYDSTAIIWQVSDGALLHTLSGHTKSVYTVAFSPDGKTVATGSGDKTIRLWRVTDGTPLRTIQQDDQSGFIDEIAFTSDGRFIASATFNLGIQIWQVNDGARLRTFSDVNIDSRHYSGLSFSRDGMVLGSTASNGSVAIWQTNDGKLIRNIADYSSRIFSTTVSADGKTIASASDRDKVVIQQISNGSVVRTMDGYDSIGDVEYSPDGQVLAIAFSSFRDVADENSIRLYHLSDDTSIYLTGHTGLPNSIAFAPDGHLLASASYDRTIRIWRVSDGALMHTLTGHTGVVQDLAFSPDGQTLVSVGGYQDNTIRLWRVSDGTAIRTLTDHSDTVTIGMSSVAFSPDGQIFASGSTDKTIRLWRDDGTLLRTLTGHLEAIYNMAFASNGEILASASEDNTVRLWRVSDGALLRTLNGHTLGVLRAAFTPDGLTLVSSSEDGTIRIWGVR